MKFLFGGNTLRLSETFYVSTHGQLHIGRAVTLLLACKSGHLSHDYGIHSSQRLPCLVIRIAVDC